MHFLPAIIKCPRRGPSESSALDNLTNASSRVTRKMCDLGVKYHEMQGTQHSQLLLMDNVGGVLLVVDFSNESTTSGPVSWCPNNPASHDSAHSLQHSLKTLHLDLLVILHAFHEPPGLPLDCRANFSAVARVVDNSHQEESLQSSCLL